VHNVSLAFQAAWKVLIVGIILGAGLPALFAAGVRATAWVQGGDAKVHADGTAGPMAHPAGRALAGLCFLVVVIAVVLGILYIVVTGLGKQLSFDHVYPTITSK
jgi:hypothetical protein